MRERHDIYIYIERELCGDVHVCLMCVHVHVRIHKHSDAAVTRKVKCD